MQTINGWRIGKARLAWTSFSILLKRITIMAIFVPLQKFRSTYVIRQIPWNLGTDLTNTVLNFDLERGNEQFYTIIIRTSGWLRYCDYHVAKSQCSSWSFGIPYHWSHIHTVYTLHMYQTKSLLDCFRYVRTYIFHTPCSLQQAVTCFSECPWDPPGVYWTTKHHFELLLFQ